MKASTALPLQPVPDVDSEGFWRATAEGRLALARCGDCGLWHQPPLERCRRCAGVCSFEPVAGTGEIYTFIVVHHPSVPGYLDAVPYVVALVELDEQPGLRLPGRVVGVGPSAVAIGDRVRAELEPLPGGDFVVPVFRPDGEAGAPAAG